MRTVNVETAEEAKYIPESYERSIDKRLKRTIGILLEETEKQAFIYARNYFPTPP